MNNDELIEACSEKLKALKDQVVPHDRKALMTSLNLSHVTVIKYLNGHVKKVDVGIRMYEFLNSRIEKRKELMSA